MGTQSTPLGTIAGTAVVTTAYMQFTKFVPPFTTDAPLAPGIAVWSGKNAPPIVGEEISVSMNSLGPAIIQGYVVMHGYLAVVVRLLTPPDWYIEQGGDGRVTVFGKEL